MTQKQPIKLWQWLSAGVLFVLLIWAFLPLFYPPYLITVYMAMVIALCAGGIFLTLRPQILGALYRALWAKGWGKALLILFHAAVLALVVTAGVFTGEMVAANARTPEPNTPLLVCGGRVTEEGPAPVLTERLNTAYDYLAENPDALCIVSGGQGADEPRPEGDVMAEYLVGKGIDTSRILIENKSADTEENIQFSAEILRAAGYEGDALAICTDAVHEYRAQENARRLGFTTSAVSSPPPTFVLFVHWVREIMAIIKWKIGL